MTLLHWMWYGPHGAQRMRDKPRARCGADVPPTQLTSNERRVTCPRCLAIIHASFEPADRSQHERENPREPANEHIRNALAILQASQDLGEKDALPADDVRAVIARLRKALEEIEHVNKAPLPRLGNRRSVRRGNPALMILGNPRVVDADRATWAKLEYHRPDDPDGEDIVRVHEFPDGFEIGWLSDGSVQLSHPKHPLWMDDGEPKR